MSDNPFAEPEDNNEHTIIRPMPGGRRAAAPKRQAAPAAPAAAPPGPPPAPPARQAAPPPAARAPEPEPPPIALPGSKLAAAAAPLLQLLARLRNTARQPDPDSLRENTERAVRSFEQRARDAAVPPEHLRPASYALCASIDDAVLNTPWGAASSWVRARLTTTFHPELTGDSRFFDALARMQQDPQKFLPVLEVFYQCLSLGYMGKYRNSPRGAADLDRLREGVGALIAQPAADLSPRWQGVAAPYQPTRGGLPVWVAAAAALAVCGALFAWVSTSLNAASDEQYARMLAAPPDHMPKIVRAVAAVQPPPPPPEPTAIDRLRASLKPDIDAGAVSIAGSPATPIVRVGTRNGFANFATLQPSLTDVLQRIGTALKAEPGQVQVLAYTDNQPTHSVKFPSNFALSAARAQAARAAVARTLGDPARLSAEGRADADPIASNATAEGREENRRIEIVLHRQE